MNISSDLSINGGWSFTGAERSDGYGGNDHNDNGNEDEELKEEEEEDDNEEKEEVKDDTREKGIIVNILGC